MLHEYFGGSRIKKWDLFGHKPFWYDKVNALLSTIGIGEKINKKDIRDILSLEGASGKKRLQRLLRMDEFIMLRRLNNIVVLNARVFVKVNMKKFFA